MDTFSVKTMVVTGVTKKQDHAIKIVLISKTLETNWLPT